MKLSRAALALALAALVSVNGGCSLGEGEGSVTSDRLFVDQCWAGPFDLKPTFFAANPFGDTLTIRVQRGQQNVLESDGFTLLVDGVQDVRATRLGERLPLGLPQGVSPLGFPVQDDIAPTVASMNLYLNNSCRGQNSTLLAVDGWVLFDRLFSGDPNEENSVDRLTEGRFEARVVDPRDAVGRASDGSLVFDDDRSSDVAGWFSFVFHRGAPAQPFP